MVKFGILTLASAALNVAFIKNWPMVAVLAGGLYALGLIVKE